MLSKFFLSMGLYLKKIYQIIKDDISRELEDLKNFKKIRLLYKQDKNTVLLISSFCSTIILGCLYSDSSFAWQLCSSSTGRLH